MKNTLFSCHSVPLHANMFVEAPICRLCFTIYHWHTNYCQSDWSFLFLPSSSCSEDVFNFFQKQTNDTYRFVSELMDVFLMAGVHQQPEQSNYQAEGQT